MTRRIALALLFLALAAPSMAARKEAVSSSGGDGPRTPAVSDYRSPVEGPAFEAIDPQGRTWAVWTYHRGLELDIAISIQVGTTWTAPELVGLPNVDDLDPRLTFAEDGTPVLVWWTRGATPAENRLFFSTRGSSGWTAPRTVDGAGAATSPNIYVVQDRVVVAYLNERGELRSSPLPLHPVMVDSGTNGPDPMPSLR